LWFAFLISFTNSQVTLHIFMSCSILPLQMDRRSPPSESASLPPNYSSSSLNQSQYRADSRDRREGSPPRPKSPQNDARLSPPPPPPPESERSPSPRKDSQSSDLRDRILYVGGLPPRIRDEDLENKFSKIGRVVECKVVRDKKTREPRGYAFVTMETPQKAEECINRLHRSELNGYTITVERARRSRPRTPGRPPPRLYSSRRGYGGSGGYSRDRYGYPDDRGYSGYGGYSGYSSRYAPYDYGGYYRDYPGRDYRDRDDRDRYYRDRVDRRRDRSPPSRERGYSGAYRDVDPYNYGPRRSHSPYR